MHLSPSRSAALPPWPWRGPCRGRGGEIDRVAPDLLLEVELGDDADQMATFVGDHDLLEAPVAEVVDRDLDRLVGVDRHDGAEVDAGEVDEGEPFSNDVVGQWPVEPLGEQRGPVPHDRVEAQRADEPTVGVEHDLQRCR